MDKLARKIELPIAKKMIRNSGLYICNKKDLNKLADVAANSYVNYPLHNWFSNGKYNSKITKIIIKISLKTMMKDAVIYADSPDLNGFAVWLPYGFKGTKSMPFILYGGLKLIFLKGFKIIKKLISYENFAMALKKKYTHYNDWYLYNLTVKQESQGKGIATKILNPMLELCDKEQMLSFLETNKESNVSLYEHYGYELKEESIVPNSNVKHFAMIRKPKKL